MPTTPPTETLQPQPTRYRRLRGFATSTPERVAADLHWRDGRSLENTGAAMGMTPARVAELLESIEARRDAIKDQQRKAERHAHRVARGEDK